MARLAPPNSEGRPRFSHPGGTQDMTIINESGLRLSDSIIEAASEKKLAETERKRVVCGMKNLVVSKIYCIFVG